MKPGLLSAIKVAYISLAVAALLFGGVYAYFEFQSPSNVSDSKKVPKEEPTPWVREAPPEAPRVEQAPPAQHKEEPPKIVLESSPRVSIPPEISGLGVIRLEFFPGAIVKEILRDCQQPARCNVNRETYQNYVGFTVDSSKVSILQWIAVEGNGKSFNLTSSTGYVVDFRIPWRSPDNGTTYYLGKLIGDGKVNIWKEGEKVQVKFGFITNEKNPQSAVSEQSAVIVVCKNVAEPTACNK